jgi:hypothetical protein
MPIALARVGYGLFILMAIYFATLGHDMMTAASNLGIGLIFDPFNPVPWAQRPTWQRTWLVVHGLATIGLFAYGWFSA